MYTVVYFFTNHLFNLAGIGFDVSHVDLQIGDRDHTDLYPRIGPGSVVYRGIPIRLRIALIERKGEVKMPWRFSKKPPLPFLQYESGIVLYKANGTRTGWVLAESFWYWKVHLACPLAISEWSDGG